MTDMAGIARKHVSDALAEMANPAKAEGMQAYMKTDMPFYGVQKAGRTMVMRELARELQLADRDQYEAVVLGLWELPHREEKYIAISVARHYEDFVAPGSLPLYRRLIEEGAWWDLVDEVTTKLIQPLVVGYPDEVWPEVDEWIHSEVMWLRRAAIICQIGAKGRTDIERLFRFCEERADEKEFFIRKAIGWALREYSKTDPAGVAAFATAKRGQLSGLSYREATKRIRELVDER